MKIMMEVYVFPFDSQMLIKARFVEALSPVLGLVQNNIPSLFLIEPSLCKTYPNGKKIYFISSSLYQCEPFPFYFKFSFDQ